MRRTAKMAALIILALFIVLAALLGAAYLSFNGRINREISGLLAAAKTDGPSVLVTEEMIRNLPPPVQKYMSYTGVLGKTIPRTIRLKQTGRIRQDARSAWMKLEAEEFYSTNPPGFVWKVFMPSRRFPVTLGRDAYLEGRGSMIIKMLSLFPLVNAGGSEIDQGSMMRYLNEMTWFPAAFLGSNISWKAVDETSAEVTLTDRGRSATATMYFYPDGKPLVFVAQRYRMVGKHYDLETWSTPFTGFGEFEGLKLPIRGKGIWNLKDGDFAYVELEVTELVYDEK